METYHKINSIFKRHMDGPKKGKLISGEWSQPEFEYLSNNVWTFTEKLDGMNCRIGFFGENWPVRFGGRSDNAQLPAPLTNWMQEYFTPELFVKAGIEPNTMLIGEAVGPKIQNGTKYSDRQTFVLFDVKVRDWWLRRDDVNNVGAKLGVVAAPVVGDGTLQDAVDIVSSGITFNTGGGLVRWGHGGLQSRLGDFEAEGIVARPEIELFDRSGRRIICKIKGCDFK